MENVGHGSYSQSKFKPHCGYSHPKKDNYPWNCQVNYKRNKKKNGIACLMGGPISDRSQKKTGFSLVLMLTSPTGTGCFQWQMGEILGKITLPRANDTYDSVPNRINSSPKQTQNPSGNGNPKTSHEVYLHLEIFSFSPRGHECSHACTVAGRDIREKQVVVWIRDDWGSIEYNGKYLKCIVICLYK